MGGEIMTITTKWLRKTGACSEGQAWFANHYPTGKGAIDDVLQTLLTSRAPGNWFAWVVDKTGLTALPEGLSVGGDLYLRECTGLTALPEGLSVGGAIYGR